MDITKRKALKYAILPGFIPRIFALVTSGFSTLAYYMATVYNIVKLLPDDHPYLQAQNIGKFGTRHVIIAAADNLVFKWKNIDQIIIYFTILGGLVLIGMQLILLVMALLASQTAFAGQTPGSFGLGFNILEMFKNPSAVGAVGPNQDIAFIIMDRVFGISAPSGGTALFNSCIAQNSVDCENNAGNPMLGDNTAYPYPFHKALHFMLRYYSMGIIVIAAMIFIYFTITIVGETATTGTPFGQRFNRAWAPVRFVLFFAMIIPLNVGGAGDEPNAGLNGAQLVTFMTAKFGSNFATNAWVHFDKTLATNTSTYIGNKKLIATPNRPEVGGLLKFIMVAKTCALAESMGMGNKVIPYIVRPSPPAYFDPSPTTPPPTPTTATQDAIEFLNTSYVAARDFSHLGDIKIRFGVQGTDTTGTGTLGKFSEYAGNVKPYCGDMTIHASSPGQNPEPGAILIEWKYYEMVKGLWKNPEINSKAECLVRTLNGGINIDLSCAGSDLLDATFVEQQIKELNIAVDDAIKQGIELQLKTPNTTLIKKGWAGAAIWYNRIAEMNGGIITAVNNIPQHNKYPWVMEIVKEERARLNANMSGIDRYNPLVSNEQEIKLPLERHKRVYPAIYAAYYFFEKSSAVESTQTAKSKNAFIDTVNFVLGTNGLFEMRKKENQDTHPLAQLTAIGKSMMDATVRNTAIAVGGSMAGGLEGIIDQFPAQMAKAASGFAFTVITSSIGIAAILYYVLPFLPFIYFLFAVSGWVKSIFEAVVAMPLWALAHIRIDGEGIPGQDASNGYFLLLEIFLRPVLILFGLIASISIFAALVSVLNNIFDLIIVNVTGYDVEAEKDGLIPTSLSDYRNAIDEFFFTAMYAIICYLMGISCFKLIDLIPNNIMRWMGTTVAAFQENAGDPAGSLTNQVYRGSVLVSNQVKGATQGNLAAILS